MDAGAVEKLACHTRGRRRQQAYADAVETGLAGWGGRARTSASGIVSDRAYHYRATQRVAADRTPESAPLRNLVEERPFRFLVSAGWWALHRNRRRAEQCVRPAPGGPRIADQEASIWRLWLGLSERNLGP